MNRFDPYREIRTFTCVECGKQIRACLDDLRLHNWSHRIKASTDMREHGQSVFRCEEHSGLQSKPVLFRVESEEG